MLATDFDTYFAAHRATRPGVAGSGAVPHNWQDADGQWRVNADGELCLIDGTSASALSAFLTSPAAAQYLSWNQTVEIFFRARTGGWSIWPLCRATVAGRKAYYGYLLQDGSYGLGRMAAGVPTHLFNGAIPAPVADGEYIFRLTAILIAAGQSELKVEIFKLPDIWFPIVASPWTADGNAGMHAAAGVGGVAANATSQLSIRRIRVMRWEDNGAAPPIADGGLQSTPIWIDRVNRGVIECTATYPVNGSPPFGILWHRSGTADFVPGAATEIAESFGKVRLIDAPSAVDQLNHYKAMISDNLGSEASNVATALLGSGIPERQGFIGDSTLELRGNFNGEDVMENAAQAMRRLAFTMYGVRMMITNRAVSGSFLTAAGAPNWTAAGTLRAPAIAAMTAAGVTHCNVMLGQNDISGMVAGATWGAALADLCNVLIAVNITPIIHWPTMHRPMPGSSFSGRTEQMIELLKAYGVQIDLLANGSSIIRGAGREMLGDFGASPFLTKEGIHPNEAGVGTMAVNMLLAQWRHFDRADVLGALGFGSAGGAVAMESATVQTSGSLV